jgi:glycerol-3-phosphate dehydrogenase
VKPDFDIAVIGGGINGAGIARDAALRGLRVILLEKNDFGSGTTSYSSRLIHGGLRYLEYGEIPLVFESLHERRRLRHLAAHLVDQIKLTIPIYRESKRSKFIIHLGMIAYDLLSLGKKMPGHRMLSRRELLEEVPGLREEGLEGGAQYYDAQVSFAERLVLENIISAKEAGADVRNYSPVVGIVVKRGVVQGLQFADRASGREVEINVPVIINAAGPWVDRVLATVNREMPVFMGGTKGSHIVVGTFAGAPATAFYVEAHSDGRPFFIIPWNSQYLIGTTDIRYEGDPGDVTASAEEIDYLLSETNRVFPSAGLTVADIHFTYAGVRPLPKMSKGPESAITRKHIIFRHQKQARGLISIIGGKLTTYRSLAEQTVDKAATCIDAEMSRCRTRTEPLPGSSGLDAAADRIRKVSGLSEKCVARLLSIYGSRSIEIAEQACDGGVFEYVDESETVPVAEVVHVVRNEMAVTLVDIIHRRTMVGLLPDQGVGMAQRIARIAADELGWDKPEIARQLELLDHYNARLRPPTGIAQG